MLVEKILPLAKGIVKKLFVGRNYDYSTGGTNNSRYCYTIWMRHLVFAYNNGIKNINGTIAELGPGDSLGIGLTALLTGCSKYYAMDVHKYWDIQKNLEIFDELVLLLKSRAAIPGDDEFPRVTPSLRDYTFPAHILTDKIMGDALKEERIAMIRNEIKNLERQEQNTMIRYFIPWNDDRIIEDASVDFIYSQAVLQYVDNLDETFQCIHKWLKPAGVMSHSIDLSSHGITRSWNGHWLFSEKEWKLIHGNNKIILNRAPRSKYLSLIKKYHFEVVDEMRYSKPSLLSVKHFAKQFRELITEDSTIHAIVLQARKLVTFFALFCYQPSQIFS